MSDEPTVGVPGAEPGQAPPEGTTQPETITQEQFQKVVDQLAQLQEKLQGVASKEELSKAYQSTQSMVDSSNARVKEAIKRVEEKVELERLFGKEISPEQELTRKRDAVQALALETLTGQPSGPEPTAEWKSYVQTVNQHAEDLFEAAGFKIEDGDPEVEIINAAADKTGEEYLAATKKAIADKRQRLASGETPPPEPALPGSPQARLPAGKSAGAANPIENLTGAALWDKAREDMLKGKA